MRLRAAAAAAALFLGLASPASSQALQPGSFPALQFQQHPGAQLPLDAPLRDESGAPVSLGAYFGRRPVVLVLEYLHCPNLCGLVLGGTVQAMLQAGLRPGRDLEFVAVSIDPRETPADAAAARTHYAERLGGANAGAVGWHFLTGAEPAVRRVAAAVGFPYRWDPQLRQFAHPAGIVVATPDGRISRYLLGLQPPPGTLGPAVAAAAHEQVAPPAYPLLLLCLGYDPQPGTVAAAVIQAVRVVAAAAAVLLLLLIVRLARRRTRS